MAEGSLEYKEETPKFSGLYALQISSYIFCGGEGVVREKVEQQPEIVKVPQ